ncbi:hypothetical protein SAMN05428969_0068 [Devosia sp. YR412]|uniref:reverse transcriptase family protein n=1 Tax=Devosia sp. YR412 TaxID=1881030 RepID=UPI0008D81B1F|nr:reverse transcriptase family protein [Devosia sp. YR412]SEP60135.1 hypothetical protein SAMN05428969_0068 [Devosia sp. YR412]
MPRRAPAKSERYQLHRSPLAQRPTQRDIAKLLGETRDDLRRLVNYKEEFVQRRKIESVKSGKIRELAYPVGRLRGVHERLKFHLNKIKQPSYLFSPRRGFGQRDNAAYHIRQDQFLTLDLKQFYPSTSGAIIKRWLWEDLGMPEDVAGLLMHLVTVDEKASLGSPVTPVLCSLIHRKMFDRIAEICDARGLRYSVWVDDLTISGRFVPGDVLMQVRDIIRTSGLRSHKIKFRTGSRPVFITGIGVVGPHLVAPNTLHLRIQAGWADYHDAVTDDEKDAACQTLLSFLGTLRHISGRKSKAGQKVADQMNALRMEREVRQKFAIQLDKEKAELRVQTNYCAVEDLPFDL